MAPMQAAEAAPATTTPSTAGRGSPTPSLGSLSVQDVADVGASIVGAVADVVDGKRDEIRLAVTVLLAGGHLLVEDVPGVGKTMLAKALARSLDASVRRVQFTPDLLPSDITGVSVYDQETREFEFKPGAIFANIVIGDEINRASPKTQSALLECMEEQQVTIDGVTYALEAPFMVIATQNPVEMEGTYPLPEAQRDRFMAQLTLGYPGPAAELRMLDTHGSGSPLDDVVAVTDGAQLAALSLVAQQVHTAPDVSRYAVDLVTATRSHPALRLGASPRATLHLLRAARAHAALARRDYLVPDDLALLAPAVLAHRLLLRADATASRTTAAEIVAEVVHGVPVPDPTAG